MTNQIKEFDKQNLKTLRSDIEAALAEVAKKHGITLGVGNISFRADSFSAKITAATVAEGDDSDGVMSGKQMKWAQDFKSHASLFGMKHTDLGKTVTIGAFTYVIVGARPRAKQNIVLQNPNGGFNVQEASVVAKFLK
jgi:hypothetical protein